MKKIFRFISFLKISLTSFPLVVTHLQTDLIQAQTRINCSGVYYLNPTVPVGASNFSYSNRNGSSYESQNGLILSRFMLTDIRSVLRSGKKTKRQNSRGAIFAAPGNISLAGQQNPTCGTMAFFDATRGMGNLHEINTLRRVEAFGTAVAKRFRVVGFPSRPHCIQFSLSLL